MADTSLLLLSVVSFSFCIQYTNGGTVAVDESLGKAMCQQMDEFRKTQTVQKALKNRDDFPHAEGCGWVHWIQCQSGKDCSTFSKKSTQSCPQGAASPNLVPGEQAPKPPPSGGGGGGGKDGTWITMNAEVDGTAVCYSIDPAAKLSAEQASAKCKESGAGDLVAIESEFENVIVEALLHTNEVDGDAFWTSADLSSSPPKWKSSGKEFPYADPSLGEGSGQCMSINVDDGKLVWKDASCDSNFSPFCEREGGCGTSPPPPASPDTALPAGVVRMNAAINGMAKCYTTRRPGEDCVDDAENFCTAGNYGRLVAIETEEEQAIIHALLRSTRIAKEATDMGYWTSADLSSDPPKWQSTGKQFEYVNPDFDKGSGKECMVVVLKGDTSEWRGVDCAAEFNVLCEADHDCSEEGNGDLPPPPPPPSSSAPSEGGGGGASPAGGAQSQEEDGATCSEEVAPSPGDATGSPTDVPAPPPGGDASSSPADGAASTPGDAASPAGGAHTHEDGDSCSEEIAPSAGGAAAAPPPGDAAAPSPADGAAPSPADAAVPSPTDVAASPPGDGASPAGGAHTHDDGASCSEEVTPSPGDAAAGSPADAAGPPPEDTADPGNQVPSEQPSSSSAAHGGGHIHLSGSLTRSICKQMKEFKKTQQLQEPLDDREKFTTGDEPCDWFQWQQCESRGDCAKFNSKSCNEVSPAT